MAKKRYTSFDQWLSLDRETGCYNFTGGKVGAGYGRMRVGQKLVLAHRYAYEMAFGETPGGMLVCHRCDNPACCNPDHLFLGSQLDNMKDRGDKSRYSTQAAGTDNGSAKLSDAEVLEIRKLVSLGVRQIDIAKQFGVTQPLVSMIALRKKWRHL